MGKATFYVVMAILSTSLVGVAYAAWSNQLTVTSYVETGSLNVTFTQVSSNDPPGTPDPNSGRDIATCFCSIANGGKSILISVVKAYPRYNVQVTFVIKNTGTIPARLREPVLEYDRRAFSLSLSGSPIANTVLDPGQTLTSSLNIFVLPGPRNRVYPFTVTVPAIQWNR